MRAPVKFGNYYLFERINVGGMAEVFKGASYGVEGFERLFAVKRVLPNISEDQEFIEMFIDEAKIAVQLNHANIGQIFELGNAEDSYFIAMEFVQGKDLRAIFDRARRIGVQLPLPMVCHIIKDVCEALEYAHNKKNDRQEAMGLVHRDVSPQNVLVSYDGEVKLIDFGIAKAAGKASRTQAGILKGKFGYMSPEQVRGKPIDHRSDLFALGVVLFEMLTLERCFLGESDFSTLEKVRNVDIRRPSTLNRDIPPELENIVLRALARSPDDRFQTAAEFQDALQKYLYQSGAFYARKDLASFMRDTFHRDINDEQSKLSEFRAYAQANIPESRRGGVPDPVVSSGSLNGATPSPAPALVWDDDELETSVWEGSKVSKAPSPPPGRVSRSPFNDPPTVEDSPAQRPQGASVDTGAGLGTAETPEPAFVTEDARRPQDVPTMDASAQVGMGLPPTLYQRQQPNAGRRILILALLACVAVGIAVAAWWALQEKDAATAVMNVTSEPPEVTIYLDGRVIHDGPTPIRLQDIPAGERRMVISAPGYETATKIIPIEAGRLVKLSIKLNEKGAVQRTGLALHSEPSGARIWVDDQPRSERTPIQLDDLTPGRHRVRLHKDSYLPWEGDVEVKAGEIFEVPSVKLYPAQINLTVLTEPDGATVQILSASGETLAEGKAPHEFSQVENGAGVKLKVEHPDYDPYEKALDQYPQALNTERITLTAKAPDPTPSPSRSRKPRRPTRPRPTAPKSCVGEDCPDRQQAGSPKVGGEPAKDPKPADPPPAAATGPGFLSVMVTPSAKVMVDGKFLQWTPLIKHELPSGQHRVQLVRDRPPAYTREYTVRIKEGQNYKIRDSF